MILDERTEFADANSIAAVAGTALIGDVIDLRSVHRDVGAGQPIWLVITTDTSIITGGSAGTVSFQLASDAQAAIATDGSASIHIQTKAFATGASAAAPLAAGGIIACVALPAEGIVYERYLGILCVTATTTTTAGKINAFLTLDSKTWQAYAKGVD